MKTSFVIENGKAVGYVDSTEFHNKVIKYVDLISGNFIARFIRACLSSKRAKGDLHKHIHAVNDGLIWKKVTSDDLTQVQNSIYRFWEAIERSKERVK